MPPNYEGMTVTEKKCAKDEYERKRKVIPITHTANANIETICHFIVAGFNCKHFTVRFVLSHFTVWYVKMDTATISFLGNTQLE